MSKNNDAWGIEVGANAIKAIRLTRQGADLVVTDYDILPFKKVLSTPDLNIEEAIQVNLDQFLSRHKLANSNVVVSVPGHMAFARFVKLPPVDPKKIGDIVKFEAVQQIPFPIDQVEWDYQQFSQPDSPDVEVGIFAITKDRVMQFLTNYRNVGINIDAITLSPLAAYNALANDMDLTPDSPGLMIMDIGTSSTDVIIVENGQLWLRTLPIGGNNFTEALVRAFKLSFPKAEKLKREASTSKYARQIFQAMRPVFADLVQEIQRSLGYYQTLNRDAKLSRIIGLGSTFRLPGMQKFLKQQLQMEVERPNGFKRIKVDGKQEADFAEHAMNLATAYGCALQGLGVEQVNANLLPQHIIKSRLWRSKRPWFAAAAIVLLAAAGASWGRLFVEKSGYETQKTEVQANADRVVNQARGLESKMKTVQTSSDPRIKIENLRRILDGRTIWPQLMVDLDLAALWLMQDDHGRILQPDLLTNDYEKIAHIPRNQRLRIYVSEVTAEYQFGNPAAAGAHASEAEEPSIAAGASYQDIFGKRRSEMTPPAPTPGPMQPVKPAPNPSGLTPPTFIITLKGTTPNSDGVRLVGDRYINWLKAHAERSDRPYRIIATNQLEKVEKIGENEMFSGSPAVAPAGRVSPLGGRNTRNQTLTETVSVSKDVVGLPPPPPDRLAVGGGIRFELRWQIQLIHLQDARQGEAISRERSKAAPAGGLDAPSQGPTTQPAASTDGKEDQL
ncbi:MAG: type IV pilus assembly protein PilM [Phycisphaeraceae bacterium]|nr:type IV pilus assembly protein PilM [Phycisphaeraceae bacterium]